MPSHTFLPGDLLTFYGTDRTSRLIRWGTGGPSHIGIVCTHRHEPILIESTTLCPWPCLIQGKPVSGVQAHPIWERIETYPGRVEHLPLAPIWKLSSAESELLTRILIRHWIGKPYDLAGALRSGTRVYKWTRFMPGADLGSQFCSELVAAILMRLGRLPIGNPAIYNPASVVNAVRKFAIYGPAEVVHA